jgi:hypothetical protein
MGVLFVVAILAVGALGAWFSYNRKKQRRLALARFAGQNGLTYSRQDVMGMLDYPFRLLSMGEGRGCENLVSGIWKGTPVREADYWYYTESTDSNGHTSRSYRYFSILVMDLDASLPYVSVQRETMLTRLAHHLGFHDVDLESQDFNRAFQVKAEDREFCFKLIDARMMQWMLTLAGGYGFEVRGPNAMVSCHRLAPAQILAIFDTAQAFCDHIPRLVWNAYGTKPREPQRGIKDIERSPS